MNQATITLRKLYASGEGIGILRQVKEVKIQDKDNGLKAQMVTLKNKLAIGRATEGAFQELVKFEAMKQDLFKELAEYVVVISGRPAVEAQPGIPAQPAIKEKKDQQIVPDSENNTRFNQEIKDALDTEVTFDCAVMKFSDLETIGITSELNAGHLMSLYWMVDFDS